MFAKKEAELIGGQIARDAVFYDADITEEMVAGAIGFARGIAQLSAPVSYEQVVAVQFRDLWK